MAGIVGWGLVLCGLFLGLLPTRAQVQAVPSPISRTVQCGVPVVVVYGRPFPGISPQPARTRLACDAKAKPRVLAAEITAAGGTALLGGTRLRRRAFQHGENLASGPPDGGQ